jgi:hypothetical protein
VLETVCVDDTTTGVADPIATGVEFVNDVVLVGIGSGSAVSESDHASSVPVLPAVSSETRSVHVPFGSSPRNAPRPSSGASGDATTPFA